MADTDLSTETDELEEPEAAELEDDAWEEDLDEDFDDDDEDVDDDLDDDLDEAETSDDDAPDEDEEALDELEAEELEMLTDDEASETLIVDEAQELRAIRRAEISLADDAGGEREPDEFLCQSCFLLKKSAQLADKRRKLCKDCA